MWCWRRSLGTTAPKKILAKLEELPWLTPWRKDHAEPKELRQIQKYGKLTPRCGKTTFFATLACNNHCQSQTNGCMWQPLTTTVTVYFKHCLCNRADLHWNSESTIASPCGTNPQELADVLELKPLERTPGAWYGRVLVELPPMFRGNFPLCHFHYSVLLSEKWLECSPHLLCFIVWKIVGLLSMVFRSDVWTLLPK